ncbi:hypothetical protein OHB01_00215 [Microbispora hainanensis]|uniref:hypothetical protein n=1 Tax=Microbispora hainanensis TaxID=568844 RepID=UPI002E2D3ED9|nr:hypothetical protein [Microbispora hainanensis]
MSQLRYDHGRILACNPLAVPYDSSHRGAHPPGEPHGHGHGHPPGVHPLAGPYGPGDVKADDGEDRRDGGLFAACARSGTASTRPRITCGRPGNGGEP